MASHTAQANDATAKSLNMLKRIRKLDGTALISGGVLLHEDCPRGSDTRLFSQSVVHLFEELEKKGEYANEILLGFDGGQLLLMFRYPVVLCLFFDQSKDVKSIEKGGNQFLTQFSSALGIQGNRPKPVVAQSASTQSANHTIDVEKVAEVEANDEEAWTEFRRQVEILFTKVLGSAQASRIITRELKAMGVSGDGYLRKNQFRPFGQKLTGRIKDKSIRRQIENELVTVIDAIL